MLIPTWLQPRSSDLGWLTLELRQAISPCPFRYEWSNARQGFKLLISGDWGRRRTHTTRTIHGADGRAIRKQPRPLNTHRAPTGPGHRPAACGHLDVDGEVLLASASVPPVSPVALSWTGNAGC